MNSISATSIRLDLSFYLIIIDEFPTNMGSFYSIQQYSIYFEHSLSHNHNCEKETRIYECLKSQPFLIYLSCHHVITLWKGNNPTIYIVVLIESPSSNSRPPTVMMLKSAYTNSEIYEVRLVLVTKEGMFQHNKYFFPLVKIESLPFPFSLEKLQN